MFNKFSKSKVATLALLPVLGITMGLSINNNTASAKSHVSHNVRSAVSELKDEINVQGLNQVKDDPITYQNFLSPGKKYEDLTSPGYQNHVYSSQTAKKALKSHKVDWNKEALITAKLTCRHSPLSQFEGLSKHDLYKNMTSDNYKHDPLNQSGGYTKAQARYAIKHLNKNDLKNLHDPSELG